MNALFPFLCLLQLSYYLTIPRVESDPDIEDNKLN